HGPAAKLCRIVIHAFYRAPPPDARQNLAGGFVPLGGRAREARLAVPREPIPMADLPTFHPDTKLVDEVVPSPNYDQRRVDIVVLHSIGSATMDEALRVLTR